MTPYNLRAVDVEVFPLFKCRIIWGGGVNFVALFFNCTYMYYTVHNNNYIFLTKTELVTTKLCTYSQVF